MDGPRIEKLPRFYTIGLAEKLAVGTALKTSLSGYLGGRRSTGYYINRLENEWCTRFNCKHAIACNSATSGLLAACMAIGIKPGDVVWTTAYSMSATAACAKVLGATIVFIDIETLRFSMNMNNLPSATRPTAIIVTNLFGHPAYLATMRSWCDSNKVWMIEDNAQSPFAMEGGRYAGTVGHLGVFSLNVHKHLQSGEGGIVVTDSDGLATLVAGAINHGELDRGTPMVGLNLRMTEATAAIAWVQLNRAEGIIDGRIYLACQLTEMFQDVPWIMTPRSDVGCRHVYYLWAARVMNGKRGILIDRLNARGFPMRAGYSTPLNKIFRSKDSCPVAHRMEAEELISFEICAYSPKPGHIRTMKEIAQRATEGLA